MVTPLFSVYLVAVSHLRQREKSSISHLTAASVQAYDLRAGAAMVIAALAAEGTSEVSNVHYIERGYEDIIGKLRNLGAQIDSVECDETVETRQIG